MGSSLFKFFICSILKSDVKQTKKIKTTFKKTVINTIESQPGKKFTNPNNFRKKVKNITINRIIDIKEDIKMDLRYIFLRYGSKFFIAKKNFE